METMSRVKPALSFAGAWRLILVLVLVPALGGLVAACTGLVVYSSADTQVGDLHPDLLGAHRFAFITPSTITGREEDKQALALAFVSVLREKRPDIHLVPLSETLSAVNAAGLSQRYRDMYDDYRDTGIFRSDILRQVGEVTHSRFLIQLKLAQFEQDSAGRWSMLGFRLVETKRARMRLFFQIWDSVTGRIVWESLHELSVANDTYTERAVTFRDVARRAASDVAGLLPSPPPSPPFPEQDEGAGRRSPPVEESAGAGHGGIGQPVPVCSGAGSSTVHRAV